MFQHKHAWAVAALGIAFSSSNNATAQTDDVLRGMDSMRRGLEPAPQSRRAPGSAAQQLQTPEPSPWLKVKPGMSETEVMNILGVPDRIENQTQTFRWHWDKGKNKGWVHFDNTSRKVVEWRNI